MPKVVGVVMAAIGILMLTVASAGIVVTQKDRAFSVKEIQVQVGEDITFINADPVTHNIYSLSKGLEFEIKTQAPGQTDNIRFPRAGVAEVLCAIHPKMRLLVRVER